MANIAIIHDPTRDTILCNKKRLQLPLSSEMTSHRTIHGFAYTRDKSMPNGVVMAAFGQKYVDLADQTAESLLQHNPKLEIDLFTDADKTMGPFSRAPILQDVWIRS